MTDITQIPLNRLFAWEGNVRKTGATEGLDQLVASISAHNLLQALIVRKSNHGRYAVIDGRRRLRALSILAEDGRIAADMAVDCHIASRKANPAEIGLAANIVRVAMHPADQFEAFRALIDNGSKPADIATRFGVSESIVVKRMKLGRVSPALLDVYRNGGMSLEQVQAFAISDDHEAQERVWSGLSSYNRHPESIRDALTEGEIPASDKRVCFVGLDAYEQAGGVVRRDLFDDRNSGYILNAALLDRLVREKLESAAESVRAEGWSWIELRTDYGYGDRGAFESIEGTPAPMPEAEAAEIEALTVEAESLDDQLNDESQLDNAQSIETRLAEIRQRIDELYIAYPDETWTDEAKAMAGAVLYLTHDGLIGIARGLLRPEDMPRDTGDDTGSDTGDDTGEGDDTTGEAAPALPPKLVEDLTAQKTAAIRATLVNRPDIALVAVVHAFTLKAFYGHGAISGSCLEVFFRHRSLSNSIAKPDDCRGFTAFATAFESWRDRLPGNTGDLWAWCLGQSQETLLELMAAAAAHSLDAVQEKGMRAGTASLRHAEALADTLDLDMRDWFTPTAEQYFNRVTKDRILSDLQEAKGVPPAPAWFKLKKSELAVVAEREIASTGWLPQPLRSVDPLDPAEADPVEQDQDMAA
jgi:ParB family chromosome partitioning protein